MWVHMCMMSVCSLCGRCWGTYTCVDLCGLYGAVSGSGCTMCAPVKDHTHGHVPPPPLPVLYGPSVLSYHGKQQTPDSGQNEMPRLQRKKAEVQQENQPPPVRSPASILPASLKWGQLPPGSDLNPRGTKSLAQTEARPFPVSDSGLRVVFPSCLLEAASGQWAVALGAWDVLDTIPAGQWLITGHRDPSQHLTHIGRNSSILQGEKPRFRKGQDPPKGVSSAVL